MASALKRGCRFIVILFALLLAVAVGAGLWLWQGHRGFADAPIGGTTADATVEVASGDAFPTVLRKLREKVDRRSPTHDYVHTHYGVGYRFAAEPS